MLTRRLQIFLKTLEAVGETPWHRNLDTDEIIIFPAFWRSLGYLPEETPIRRKDFSALIHPADLGRVQSQSAQFIAGETSLLNMEFRLPTKSGEWRWFLLRGREIQRKASGEPHIAAGIISDVDEIRRAQLAAVADHERLTLAAESSNAGLWEVT